MLSVWKDKCRPCHPLFVQNGSLTTNKQGKLKFVTSDKRYRERYNSFWCKMMNTFTRLLSISYLSVRIIIIMIGVGLGSCHSTQPCGGGGPWDQVLGGLVVTRLFFTQGRGTKILDNMDCSCYHQKTLTHGFSYVWTKRVYFYPGDIPSFKNFKEKRWLNENRWFCRSIWYKNWEGYDINRAP